VFTANLSQICGVVTIIQKFRNGGDTALDTLKYISP